MTQSREAFLATTTYCLSGPLLWALHFALLYGVQHVVCAVTPSAEHSYFEIYAWLVTVFTIALMVLCQWRLGRPFKMAASHDSEMALSIGQTPQSQRFFHRVALIGAWLSLLAIFWGFMGVLLLPEC